MRNSLQRLAHILVLSTCVSSANCDAAQAQPASAPASVAAAASAPGTSQFPGLPLQRAGADDSSSLQPFGWLMFILFAFAIGALVLARRKGLAGALSSLGIQRLAKSGQSAAPVVLGRTALSPQLVVYALKWGDEELLVGGTAQSLTLLARRPCAPVDANEPEAQQ